MRNKKRWGAVLPALAMSISLLAGCGSAKGGNIESGGAAQDGAVENQGGEDQEASTETEGGIFLAMDTVDLEGNAVDASVFAENDLTMVNIWATWCGPCVHEIPILDQLNQEYEGKGVAIKGLLYEPEPDKMWGVSDSVKEAAEAILAETGATYQILTASEAMSKTNELKSLMAYPTSYFVDSKGNILGYEVGANDYDGWKEIIESYLAEAVK